MNIPNYNYESNSYNLSMTGRGPGKRNFFKKVAQTCLDKIPNKDLKNTQNQIKNKKNIDKFISSPHVNRLIIGISALLTQPFIDKANKRVDDDTRRVSVNRTIAKILAGTMVGCVVRGGAYKIVKACSNTKSNKKYSKWLMPKKYEKNFVKDEAELNNYQNALSTIISILTMGCFTNFAFDAPLTKRWTNKLNARSERRTKEGKEVVYA